MREKKRCETSQNLAISSKSTPFFAFIVLVFIITQKGEMRGVRLILFLVMVLGARRLGGSRVQPEKWRLGLKALLYEYKTSGQDGEASRQVGDSSLDNQAKKCNAAA